MKTIAIGATAAAAIQYFLLHSHKIGAKHWTWVFGASILLFFFSIYHISRRHDISGIRIAIVAGSLLCFLGPPMVYLFREWSEVPSYLINSFNQGGGAFIGAIVFVSGGWTFSVALTAWYYQSTHRR